MLSKIRDFLNVYVGALVIITLLASINIFSIRESPKIDILRPIYVFNVEKISKNLDIITKFHVYNLPNNMLAMYGLPEDFDKQKYIKYLLPYECLNSQDFQGWSSWEYGQPWYKLGLIDKSKIPLVANNNSFTRTETEKIMGLQLLIMNDFLNDAQKESLKTVFLSSNPLENLRNDTTLSEELLKNYAHAYDIGTKVYSVVSISNISSSTMDDLKLFVNNTINYTKLEVIGWTGFGNINILDTYGPNIILRIDRINPKKSIEILFKGSRYLRKNDFAISSSELSGIKKGTIIMIMVRLLINAI